MDHGIDKACQQSAMGAGRILSRPVYAAHFDFCDQRRQGPGITMQRLSS